MSRRSCKYLACAITVIPLSALAWHFRAPLLEKIANAWIVPDPLSYSYAIVVVGGGIQTRPFEAARLYRSCSSKASPTLELSYLERKSAAPMKKLSPCGNG
jgi:hypothetical protein